MTLEDRLAAYNATFDPSVPVQETARTGLDLLLEAAKQAIADETTTPRQRAYANSVIAAIGERPAR